MLLTQIKYDLKMFFREIFYLVFTIVVPPASYVLMGQMFGSSTYEGGMNYAQQYTPSFIILISFSVIFFAFGFDQVMNRSEGIEKRLLITPVTEKIFLLSSIVKSVIIASAGFFLITIMGVLIYDLKLTILSFLISYTTLIIINAIMLVYSHAIYANFIEVKSALVVSIVLFQIVMFTGGFSMPVEKLPEFVQVIANFNPMYHLNRLYVSIWNQTFILDKSTIISLTYAIALFIVALFVIKLKKKRS